MISPSIMETRPVALLFAVSVILGLAPRLAVASGGENNGSGAVVVTDFSAEDFDWRYIVPSLFTAASLPGEQAIKTILENSRVLRTYVAKQLRGECTTHRRLCATTGDTSVRGEEVSKRIDEIVQEGIFHRHKTAIVDYSLEQPFAFSEIAAVKTENRQDAYVMLRFPDHSYRAWQLQAKHGAPYDTNIVQWYSIFEYRLENPRYVGKAVFEIDPTDGAVLKVAISVKPKKVKKVR
jgi:hypothetical protein